jgi:LysR family hydrogen peroxide-inducible transcriptional activator
LLVTPFDHKLIGMDFGIRELEYFVAIADQKHFAKAAYSVHVSQPTLSMQFKKLELTLGAQLVNRLSNGITLTAFGEEVLPIARQIIKLATDLESKGKNSDAKSQVKLGIIPTLAPYLLPKIDKDLSKQSTKKKLLIYELQTKEIIRQIKDGLIDIAIVSTPINENTIEEVSIFKEPFFLAVNKQQKLSCKRSVSINDIKNEKLLLLGEGHCLRNQSLSICNLTKFTQDTDYSATSIETLRSMISINEGVTLIPKLAITKSKNISYIPITEQAAARNVGIIYRSNYHDLIFAKLLEDILVNFARRSGLILN